MPSLPHSLLSYLRDVVGAWRDDPREDAELLARFAESSDEAAFKALVYRHGPLVWRSCTRVLGDGPDAEDAFQTAFLALAHKAGRLRREPLAGWLHRVARQAALKVDIEARRRRDLEHHLRAVTPSEATTIDRVELYAALEEELAILPEQLRVPLVLRYLEGKTLEDVARIVGCSRPVISKRLVRGEAILRKRLERRGLGVGVVSVSVLLGSAVTASAVPARLIGSTTRAAVAFRSGALTGGAAEAARAVLGALPTSVETTIMRKSLCIVLACCFALAGAGLGTCQLLSARLDEPDAAESAVTQAAKQQGPSGRAAVRFDHLGDPLPERALARLGTVRLRHSGGVSSVAFSPDGKTVVSGGWEDGGTVRLWEVATGKEIRTLPGYHTLPGQRGGVRSVAFLSNGKTVAVGGDDGMVRLSDAATGKEIRTLKVHNESIRSVAFSPDERTMAVGDEDGMVRLWDVATGNEIRTLKGHKGKLYSVAFSPDGKTMLTGGWGDGMVRLWDAATGKEIRTLQGQESPIIMLVVYSPDGKTVASGGSDGMVRLWDAATGKEIRTLEKSKGWIGKVVFSPDGKTVAVGGKDGVRLWDAATGKLIRTLQVRKEWGIFAVAFSPDGKTVATGGVDQTVRLWDVATGKEKEICTQQGHVGLVYRGTFSSDGKTVVTWGEDGTVRLWKATTGKPIRIQQEHKKVVRMVALSHDGGIMATWGEDGTVRLSEAATGKEIGTLQGHNGKVRGVVFSSDGKTVVTWGEAKELAVLGNDGGGTVRLWEATTGKLIRVQSGHHPGVLVALSHDGRIMATVDNRKVRLWESATGKEIGTLQGHNGKVREFGVLQGHRGVVRGVVFASDGKTVVTGDGEDGTVRLWEVATGKEISTQKGHQGGVRLMTLSHDGRTMATGGVDGTVRLWEVATGKEIRTLYGHKRDVREVVFAPDGRILAVASSDCVQLWDVLSGTALPTLAGHRGQVLGVAFSPDGRVLASVSADATGLVWDLTFGAARPGTALGPDTLKALWADLMSKDAARARRAVWTLAATPAESVLLLRTHLRLTPASAPDPKRLARLIADLDADEFKVRQRASQTLEELGPDAVPALRKALEGSASVELRKRLEQLLEAVQAQNKRGFSGEMLRGLRAVAVLEQIGTPQAREVLKALAAGGAGFRLKEEAQTALRRLGGARL